MQHVQQQSMFVLTVLTVAILGPSGWILAHLDHYKNRGWCGWNSLPAVKINHILLLMNSIISLFVLFLKWLLQSRWTPAGVICSPDIRTTVFSMNNFMWRDAPWLSVSSSVLVLNAAGAETRKCLLILGKSQRVYCPTLPGIRVRNRACPHSTCRIIELERYGAF